MIKGRYAKTNSNLKARDIPIKIEIQIEYFDILNLSLLWNIKTENKTKYINAVTEYINAYEYGNK